MSDTEKKTGEGKANTGWTDKERLVYFIGLLEHTGSGVKLDFKGAPCPNGRSEIACERMVGRIKDKYKSELEALRAGQAFDGEPAPKATPRKKAAKDDENGTPKTAKRKAKGGEDGDGASPKKRGKKGVTGEAQVEVKDEVAGEVKNEDVVDQDVDEGTI